MFNLTNFYDTLRGEWEGEVRKWPSDVGPEEIKWHVAAAGMCYDLTTTIWDATRSVGTNVRSTTLITVIKKKMWV